MMAYFYLMFGVLFGVKMGKGNSDGSIVMFCRINKILDISLMMGIVPFL